MIFKETPLKGAFIIELEKISDDRGFFSRTWCRKEFEAQGLSTKIAQCNLTFSANRGTLRGLHYQNEPHEEAKTVSCIRGKIYDVILDIRPDSPSYLKWIGIELSPDNRKMIYIPENFAHGYLTLDDNSEVFYQVSQFYAPGSEGGIRWNDPTINIEWPEVSKLILSEKDKAWPDFKLKI